MNRGDALLTYALLTERVGDQDGLAAAAEQTDVASVGVYGRADAIGIHLMAARRDDEKRLRSVVERPDVLRDVPCHHRRAIEPFGIGKLRAILEDGDVEIEQTG